MKKPVLSLLDKDLFVKGLIHHYEEDVLEEHLENNELNLSFYTRQEIEPESYIIYPTKHGKQHLLVVKRIEEEQGTKQEWYRIEAESAATGELINAFIYPNKDETTFSLEQAMSYALETTDWEVGETPFVDFKDISFEWTSVKDALNIIAGVFGAELEYEVIFNGSKVMNKIVHAKMKRGQNKGLFVEVDYNSEDVRKTVNSDNLISALYVVGKDDLTLQGYQPITGKEGFLIQGSWIENRAALQEIGYRGHHKFGLLHSDSEDPESLWLEGLEVLEANMKPQVEYEFGEVLLPGAQIGDDIMVKDFERNDKEVFFTRVIEAHHSHSDPALDKIVLGQHSPKVYRYTSSEYRAKEKAEELVEDAKKDLEEQLGNGLTAASEELAEAQDKIDKAKEEIAQLEKEFEEAPKYTFGTEFPPSPKEGDLFYKQDTSGTIVSYYIYKNGSWELGFARPDPAEMDKYYDEELIPELNRIDEAISNVNTELGEWQKTVGDKADYSAITQLQDDINLRVKKGEVVNQINVSTEKVLISGKKIDIEGNTIFSNLTTRENGITKIDGGMIDTYSISANKINVGTLSALSSNLGEIYGGSLDIGGRFKVDSEGYLTATRATITGDITATSGTFTGEINATKGRFTGTIIGASIQGGTESDFGDVLAFGDWKGSSDGPKINYQTNAIRLANNRYNYVRVGTTNVSFIAEGNEVGNFNKDGLYVDKDQTIVGNLTVRGTINNQKFPTTSARELKKNIEPFSCPLDQTAIQKVVSTPVYKYNYLDDKDTDWKYTGIIIDEAPAEVVNMDGKSINLYSMISVLWKAVQEQQSIIEELTNRNGEK